MSRRIRPADENNDGSEGRWVGGLPAAAAPDLPTTTIDYVPEAGCPREHTGGTYRPNVTGAPQPAPSPSPSPFKIGK